MTKLLFWVILFSSLLVVNGCGQKENKDLSSSNTDPAAKQYTLNVDLPFESSNYYGADTWFVLMDQSGKYVMPFHDTVTKGGGHIDYDSLPGGIYNFRIRTVFNEFKTGKIVLDKNIYESFGLEDVYTQADSITEKMLVDADSIKIVFAEPEFGPSHIFMFMKEKNKYKMQHYISDGGYDGHKQTTQNILAKDSPAVIAMLIKFHAVVNGIENMELTQDHDGSSYYDLSEAYYIKADNTFYYSHDLQNKYFKEAYKQFKNSFFSKR